ncbi:cobaltochelatase CobT [Paralcaligenes ureilyticus]|uniref:Cobaltochelatase CobT n=2 Tax=Paralcaligenes ureilyticus TaxID=627131 RepID=A0A4R3LM21_9BURK|nr:cobaltochelatase CobT [Paralcaligenes ureilyticus]
MGDMQQRSRHQQQLEELCVAMLRAATGLAQWHFEGGRLYDGQRPVPAYAPHLRINPGVDALPAYRALADSLALRLRFSDPVLHQGLVPADPIERWIFEWLEQLRVESLAPEDLPGVRDNLEQRYRAWSAEFLGSGSTETSLGILMFALSQIVWSRLTSLELPRPVQDLLEPTRAALAPALGSALAGIRRCRHDQAQFAIHAMDIARDIAQRVQSEYEDEPSSSTVRPGAFGLWLDFEQEESESAAVVQTGESAVFEASRRHYRIFTKRYDEERYAPDLVREALLHEYRQRLDRRIAQQGINVQRLSSSLRAILAQPQRDGWRFGQEEGVIDGRRLAQLVSSPAERRVFRQDQYLPVADTTLGFLIDCSGSMKPYAELLAVMMDVLMRALEQAGVATEILGFTTSAWNGGRARQDWVSQGRPAAPGRLNELRRLVFKEAQTPWRRARYPLAALLKTDLFREGIDGEAVEWACQRLLGRNETRRILVVISDGCPMDSATNQANDAFYLDNHLKAVIGGYGRQGIDIIGVGVGLDMSPYYSRSVVVDLSERLENQVFEEFLELLKGRHRR